MESALTGATAGRGASIQVPQSIPYQGSKHRLAPSFSGTCRRARRGWWSLSPARRRCRSQPRPADMRMRSGSTMRTRPCGGCGRRFCTVLSSWQIAMPGAGMYKSAGNGPTTPKSANVSTRNMIPPTFSTCWRGASRPPFATTPAGSSTIYPGPPAVPGADRAPAGYANLPDHRGLHLGAGGLHAPRPGLPGPHTRVCADRGIPATCRRSAMTTSAVPWPCSIRAASRTSCPTTAARGPRPSANPLPAWLRLWRLEVCAGRSTQATMLGCTDVTYESLYLSPAIRADRLPGRHG